MIRMLGDRLKSKSRKGLATLFANLIAVGIVGVSSLRMAFGGCYHTPKRTACGVNGGVAGCNAVFKAGIITACNVPKGGKVSAIQSGPFTCITNRSASLTSCRRGTAKMLAPCVKIFSKCATQKMQTVNRGTKVVCVMSGTNTTKNNVIMVSFPCTL